MPAQLEHTNVTVADPAATAAWLREVFGWHIRWEGDAIMGGHTKHVGTDTSYVALYNPGAPIKPLESSHYHTGGLNHIAVTVDDLDATEAAVVKQGFAPTNHGDYEPGRRFYFADADGIEWEVVSYR